MSRKSIVLAIGLLVLASLVLVACQPQTVEVIKTIEVVTTEIVAGTPVVNTVVITATPAPAEVVEPTAVPDRTLVICMGQEPDSLFAMNTNMLAASQIWEAIYDGPIDSRSFDYQPVLLEKLPSLADGDAVVQTVDVTAGAKVTDIAGNAVELAEGVQVKPAGCTANDCAITYDGTSTIQMDQLAVTFKLLPGLLWSDGTPLTAADSVYGYTLAGDPDNPLSKWLFEHTATYEAADDVTIVWTGVPGYMDATYFVNVFAFYPQHIWGQYTVAELITEVDGQMLYTGWGPYIFSEWVKGDHITLVKNPNYFRAAEGLPKFESVVYRFTGATSNASIAALLAGDCDIVDQTTSMDDQSELLLELQSAGQLNATFVTGTTWEHIDFNILPNKEGAGFAAWDEDGDGFGPFADIRLRQAIAMCMDRQAVVDTVLFGQSIVLSSYIPPEHPLYNPDVTVWPFDPAAAGTLLDEIGWLDEDGDVATPRTASGVLGVPDGTPLQFKLQTTTATMRQQATQIIAESVAGCGIKLELGYLPASEWFADYPDGPLSSRTYDLGQFAWLTGVQPPCELYKSDQISGDPTVATPYGPNFAGWGAQNYTGYGNAEYDAICNAATQALPGQPAYEENHLAAQIIFSNELPVVPQFLRLKLAVTRPDLCNFFMDPTANSEMWNIEAFDYGESCGQ